MNSASHNSGPRLVRRRGDVRARIEYVRSMLFVSDSRLARSLEEICDCLLELEEEVRELRGERPTQPDIESNFDPNHPAWR